ncbi:MAG: hypothetical protein COA42_16645 [Alteromonadaceae bacterium]|nr:MAG: hypothetical protein COA42_16645 [Alteromonadaceae bacterium]
MKIKHKITLVSESTLLITFDIASSDSSSKKEHINAQAIQVIEDKNRILLSRNIAHSQKMLCEQYRGFIVDAIPSYTTLLITVNFLKIDPLSFSQDIDRCLQKTLSQQNQHEAATRQIDIPVYYDPSTGLDLEDMARAKSCTLADIIEAHTNRDYTVFALGFLPGFAYLGFVSPDISMARKANPRQHVPKGSVGIADRQTGIYPNVSAGGWQIIGRTALPMLEVNNTQEPLCHLAVGDNVRFHAISQAEYLQQGGEL